MQSNPNVLAKCVRRQTNEREKEQPIYTLATAGKNIEMLATTVPLHSLVIVHR